MSAGYISFVEEEIETVFDREGEGGVEEVVGEGVEVEVDVDVKSVVDAFEEVIFEDCVEAVVVEVGVDEVVAKGVLHEFEEDVEATCNVVASDDGKASKQEYGEGREGRDCIDIGEALVVFDGKVVLKGWEEVMVGIWVMEDRVVGEEGGEHVVLVGDVTGVSAFFLLLSSLISFLKLVISSLDFLFVALRVSFLFSRLYISFTFNFKVLLFLLTSSCSLVLSSWCSFNDFLSISISLVFSFRFFAITAICFSTSLLVFSNIFFSEEIISSSAFKSAITFFRFSHFTI